MERIRTARLIIRPFANSDIGDFLTYQSHPEVRRYLPGEPHTPDEAERYLAAKSALEDGERGMWHDWAVEHAGSGTVIGNVGVYLPAELPTVADMGFQFHPD